MKRDIPIPGTSKYNLVHTGIKLFSQLGYKKTEVDHIATEAGVTVGALYHHFKSKKKFYGFLRDDLTLRIIDRMEAVAETVPSDQSLSYALLAAFDGMIRLKVGRLLSEPDPRQENNLIAKYLGELAQAAGEEAAHELGILLAEALRSALAYVIEQEGNKELARKALERLL